MKNNYNLRDIEDRKQLFNEYLISELPYLNFGEFEEKIDFLCNIGLADEWLSIVAITVGELVCPNNLKTETSFVESVGVKDLLTLADQLAIFNDEKISYYVKKLNTQSFVRISVLSEIKIGSAYLNRKYEIEIDPPNGKIGKSGEGKSDLGVNCNNEWIYFEVTHEGHCPPDSSVFRLGEIASYIKEQIIEHDLLPWRMKIDTLIIEKNKVLSKGWSDHLIDHLRRSSFKVNTWKEFQGVKYVLKQRQPDELIFSLSIPITDSKKDFVRKIKHEVSQIPENTRGVIAFGLSSSWNIHRFTNYAQEILRRGPFDNILAIIIWYEKSYRIIYNRSVDDQLLEFLAIPFGAM